jgi:hypothetical protein
MRLCSTNLHLYHMPEKRKRSPRGVNHSAIALRLMPGELDEANRIAEKAGISKSSMARQSYLLGLPLLKQQLATKSA